jgi:hypothetical protein
MREMRLMVEKPFVLMSEIPEDSTVILLLPTGLRLTLMPVLLLDAEQTSRLREFDRNDGVNRVTARDPMEKGVWCQAEKGLPPRLEKWALNAAITCWMSSALTSRWVTRRIWSRPAMRMPFSRRSF